MTPFEKLATDLDELARVPHRAASRAAPEVLEAVKSTFAGGQLRGLVAKTTARADGDAIVLDFDDRLPIEALHVDDNAGPWTKPIDEALAAEGLR